GVAHPEELAATQLPVSYPLYQRFRAQSALFARTAGWIAPVPFDVVLNQGTQRIWGQFVTPSYFATFGIRPALGGFFDASWDTPGRAPAVVVSDRFWREHLAGDPAIAGRALRINGRPVTVLGVAQPGFLGASPIFFTADLFLPVTADPAFAPELNRGAGGILDDPAAANLRVTARLRPGVTLEQAEAALDAVSRQFAREHGADAAATRVRRTFLVPGGRVIPMRKQDLPYFGSVLIVLAALVMLIACASVATMKLAHAASRRREIAVRLALGASRARIVRQLLIEAFLLTGIAGLLGFLASAWLLRSLSHLRMPYPMPVSYDFQPDGRVLLFTLLMTIATGLLFGLAPALQAARTDLAPALKEGGDVRLGSHRRLSLRNLLIVSQVAGSLTLLVILGLLSFGMQGALGMQTGFDPAHLYLISLDPVRDGYTPAQAAAFLPKLLDRVQGLAAVKAAALTETVPVAMVTSSLPISRPGRTRHLDRAIQHVVGKDYFATVGIPLLAGHAFRREDETANTPAVIVSAAFSARFFPGEDPLGQPIDIGTDDPAPSRTLPGSFDYRGAGSPRTAVIAGVVGDIAEGLIVEKPRPVIYFPLRAADYAQPSPAGLTLIVRAVPGVDPIAQVRREAALLDPNVTTFHARSLHDHVEEFMTMLRSAAWTYLVVGIFGYILSAVGLAGVTAYTVQRRRRELGIRMALGATAGRVVALVVKEGAALAGIGTLLGICGGLAGSRGLAAFNSGAGRVTTVDPYDPRVIGGAALLLGLSALIACYLPARRSACIDPAVTLRQE
ncbi:MAG: ABC transporter permease, partial [Acidobacteriota bacterium]|nr:ABC transporter permease [Acidobacteriota bacterium]